MKSDMGLVLATAAATIASSGTYASAGMTPCSSTDLSVAAQTAPLCAYVSIQPTDSAAARETMVVNSSATVGDTAAWWDAKYLLRRDQDGFVLGGMTQAGLTAPPPATIPVNANSRYVLQGSAALTGANQASSELGANHLRVYANRVASGQLFSAAAPVARAGSSWTTLISASSSTRSGYVPLSISGVFEGSLQLPDDSSSRDAINLLGWGPRINFFLDSQQLSGSYGGNLGYLGISAGGFSGSLSRPMNIDASGLLVWSGTAVHGSSLSSIDPRVVSATHVARGLVSADGSVVYEISLPWTTTFSVPANGNFVISALLEALVNDGTGGLGAYSGEASFLNTARVTGFSVSPDVTLSTSDGRLVLSNGQYSFASAVPEPAASLMLTVGIGVLVTTRRRPAARPTTRAPLTAAATPC